MIKINANFNERALVKSAELEWVQSPIPGVDRKPLDRVGAEIARATSLVRYERGSEFSPHVHSGGEEFVVLEGVFQDEHGDYPRGSYVRNPPQSRHTPRSTDGCTIFVKLWQFQPNDRTRVSRNFLEEQPASQDRDGQPRIIPLYQSDFEEVFVLEAAAGEQVNLQAETGIELLVLEGKLKEGDSTLDLDSWLRLPAGHRLQSHAGKRGVKVWVKRNHLGDIASQIKRLQAPT